MCHPFSRAKCTPNSNSLPGEAAVWRESNSTCACLAGIAVAEHEPASASERTEAMKPGIRIRIAYLALSILRGRAPSGMVSSKGAGPRSLPRWQSARPAIDLCFNVLHDLLCLWPDMLFTTANCGRVPRNALNGTYDHEIGQGIRVVLFHGSHFSTNACCARMVSILSTRQCSGSLVQHQLQSASIKRAPTAWAPFSVFSNSTYAAILTAARNASLRMT